MRTLTDQEVTEYAAVNVSLSMHLFTIHELCKRADDPAAECERMRAVFTRQISGVINPDPTASIEDVVLVRDAMNRLAHSMFDEVQRWVE